MEKIGDILAAIAEASETELAAVLAAVAGRLAVTAATPPPPPPPADELVDDVDEVARIVRHSVSWVRKSGHTLPGFTQPGGKGTRVAWSRRALEAWANGEDGAPQTISTRQGRC
jgi:hypothetical protein